MTTARLTKIGITLLIAIGFASPQTPALGADFNISNVSVPPHAGVPTLTFDVTGAIAAKFSNCSDLMRTLGPIVKLTDDQGAKSLLVSASWGLTAKTLKIMSDGLSCEIRTAEADTYNFAPNQDSTPQTYELIFGTVSAVGKTTILNSTLAPIAPQIVSPIRGQNVAGYAVVDFDSDLGSKFKVYKRWISASGTECCIASVGSFDEPLRAYILFDEKDAAGKTLEISATWFYTNASGANGYVSRSVTVNVDGSGSPKPIPQNVMAKVKRAKLRALFGCEWPKPGIQKLNCSVRPKFTIMTDIYDQLVLKDFSGTYSSKLKIQTSSNGKSWKTVRTLAYKAGAESKFSVPFYTKQPKNYLRVVSDGIPFTDSTAEFSKYSWGRALY
jgi:hypothetical protein